MEGMALISTAKRALKTTSLLFFSQHPDGTCLLIVYVLTYAPPKVNDGFKRPGGGIISMRSAAHLALDLKCAKGCF